MYESYVFDTFYDFSLLLILSSLLIFFTLPIPPLWTFCDFSSCIFDCPMRSGDIWRRFCCANLFTLEMFDSMLFWILICCLSIMMMTTVILCLSPLTFVKFIFYTMILNLIIVYDHLVLKLVRWFPHCCEDTSLMKLASRVIRFVGNVRCVSLCVFVLFVEENDDGIYCWKLNRVLFCEKNGIFLEISFRIRCDLYERRNANCIGYHYDYSYEIDKSCLSWILGQIVIVWHISVFRDERETRDSSSFSVLNFYDGREQFEVNSLINSIYLSCTNMYRVLKQEPDGMVWRWWWLHRRFPRTGGRTTRVELQWSID